jgi:hypothetical protein
VAQQVEVAQQAEMPRQWEVGPQGDVRWAWPKGRGRRPWGVPQRRPFLRHGLRAVPASLGGAPASLGGAPASLGEVMERREQQGGPRRRLRGRRQAPRSALRVPSPVPRARPSAKPGAIWICRGGRRDGRRRNGPGSGREPRLPGPRLGGGGSRSRGRPQTSRCQSRQSR